jgi:uncharacterized membrane protein SpoIIM required for sporulation
MFCLFVCLLLTFYIIIWLSPYVLYVRSLSPPKPAGLDSPNFRRHAPNLMWNRDSQKKFEKKIHGKFSDFFVNFFLVKFFLAIFFQIFSMKTRSVA